MVTRSLALPQFTPSPSLSASASRVAIVTDLLKKETAQKKKFPLHASRSSSLITAVLLHVHSHTNNNALVMTSSIYYIEHTIDKIIQ